MASEQSEDTKTNPVETGEEQDIDSSVIPRKGSKLSRVQKLRRRLSQSFGRLAALAKDSSTEKPPKSRNRPFPNGFSDEYLDRLDGPDQLQKGWVHLRLSAGNGLDEVGQDPVVSNLCRHSQYASDSRLLDGPPISTTPIHVATPTRPNDPPTTRDSGLGSGSASGSAGDLRDKETWSSGVQVILRRSKKKPARPRSEVLTSQVLVAVGAGNGVEPTKEKVPERNPQLVSGNRRSKRYSAFGGDSPFGKLEAYVKLEPLGEGSYATVYKGYSNLTGQIVALKEIRLQAEEGAPFTAIREASLLKELKHANIVTLHDIVHTPQSLTFVFEFVASDLSQYLERHPGGLQPNNVRLLLYQLLRGLAFVHKRKVLHRDLKPQNLLITNNGELKLADFGLARAQSVPSHTYSPEVVTLWYRPPDVLLGLTEYGPPLDMWGVGCIFLEMLTGAPAFPGVRDAYDQLDRIWRVLGTPTEATWPGVSSLPLYKPQRFRFHRGVKLGHAFPRLYDVSGAEALALKLLQLQPNSRLTALAAMQHKFFQDLPAQLEHLSEDASIFSVSGIVFVTEERRLPPSVYRAAQDLRRKQ